MFNLLFKRSHRPNTAKGILKILDQSAKDFRFPMLDNGYIYPAASRLSLFSSETQWAIVFETFGFSPRAGHPDLTITTISNELHNRNPPSDYVSTEAYQAYIANNPSTEMRNYWPILNDDWIDRDEPELVISGRELKLREQNVEIPNTADFQTNNIILSEGQPTVFEMCRYLAETHRSKVLATEAELRVSISPNMERLMMLDNWHHPDLAAGQLPSKTQTFVQLAHVLEKRDPSLYSTSEQANNHWKHWPDGGLL